MTIKELDSKVKNAKSCDSSLRLLRVRICITEGWIMVYDRSWDITQNNYLTKRKNNMR